MRCVLLAAVVALSGCGGIVRTPGPGLPEPPPEALGQLLAPEAMRDDVAFLVRTLDEVHPDLFAFVDEAKARLALDSIATSLDAPLTRLDLWRRLAPWVASLGDGHTAMGFPNAEYARWRGGGGALFPLPVEVASDTLRLAREALGLPACTALASLDGRPAQLWVRAARAVVSGESTAYRDYALGLSFGPWLWAATGAEGPFEVVVASGDTLRLPGAVRDTARAPEVRLPSLEYQRLDDGTGWLQVRRFTDPLAAFERELEAVFAQVRREGTTRLVVDVRENGGGNSALGDALLGYLTDRPWRNASRVEWRHSRQYGRYVKSHVAPAVRWAIPWKAVPQVGGYFRTPVGENYVDEVGPSEAPGPRDLRFEGEWAVLVGTRTFSSGMLFALAVKDHGLALVVGEETGGQASGFGEVYTFALPHSGLAVRASTKRFVRPNGSLAAGGVVPDVEVGRTCASGPEDAALARAVELLRQRQGE